jgi:hypothetical protein
MLLQERHEISDVNNTAPCRIVTISKQGRDCFGVYPYSDFHILSLSRFNSKPSDDCSADLDFIIFFDDGYNRQTSVAQIDPVVWKHYDESAYI